MCFYEASKSRETSCPSVHQKYCAETTGPQRERSAVIAGCRCERLLVLGDRDGAEVFAASGGKIGRRKVACALPRKRAVAPEAGGGQAFLGLLGPKFCCP